MLRDGSSRRARPIRSRHRVPSHWLRSMIGWDGLTTPSACSRTAHRSGGTPLRSASGSACPTLSLAAKSTRRQSSPRSARSHRSRRCRRRNAFGPATSRRSFRTASPPCRGNTASPRNDLFAASQVVAISSRLSPQRLTGPVPDHTLPARLPEEQPSWPRSSSGLLHRTPRC